MREEDLDVLITLDYPWYAQDQEAFHHPRPEDAGTYWPGQPFPILSRHDDGTGVSSDDASNKIIFGEGSA
jgi:hypothetical protein